MNIWLITDTHFGHKRMIEFGRPPNFEDQILNNIKSTIKENDLLIHLGDFCIGKDKMWHHQFMDVLGGAQKHLIRGNHDQKSLRWYLNHGWSGVSMESRGIIFGMNIIFSHEPLPKVWGVDLNIHGHFHDDNHRLKDFKDIYDPQYHKLLSIENTHYKPILLKSFLKI